MQPIALRATALRAAAVGALSLSAWLLIGAMPVLADGGPHVASKNSGADGLTADTCAGCHRAHTASGEYLIDAPSIEALCFSCHGAAGVGATTNVADGVQYKVANAGAGGTVAGALRSGGFVNARIDSAHSSRISYPFPLHGKYVTQFSSYVGVLAGGAAVTSAHLDLDGAGGVVSQGKAWGNGDIGSSTGAGPVVELECTSCHNPHGNGQYRILVAVPAPVGDGFVKAPFDATVTDAALPTGTGGAETRNYTVQNGRTLKAVVDAAAGPTAGDYWRRYMPWNLVPGWDGTDATPVPVGGHSGDVPMYDPAAASNLLSFRLEISSWCAACHSRYLAGSSDAYTSSGDPLFTYRHTTSRTECTLCHVAHGSNASMTGTYASTFPYPDDNPLATRNLSASSRLLKIDNRGTCQACHDPTGTIPFDGSVITH